MKNSILLSIVIVLALLEGCGKNLERTTTQSSDQSIFETTITPEPTESSIPTGGLPAPTLEPTAAPTIAPTSIPISFPTPTPLPTPTNAIQPTTIPILTPTTFPTIAPTTIPTSIPTSTPSPTPLPGCAQTQTCKINLAWDYDATELALINGFRVYWGPISRFSPGFTTYSNYKDTRDLFITITSLGNETTYFSVTAFNIGTNGELLESGYSGEVVATLDDFLNMKAMSFMGTKFLFIETRF